MTKEPKTPLCFANGSTLKAVIAISDRSETLPTLATAQVLSLFGLEKHIIAGKTIPDNLPKESILLLTEQQIRQLVRLRQQGFAGAVVILSTEPFTTLLKRHHYILRYGQSSNTAWEPPWQLPDLLSQITQLKPLSRGNLNLLKQEMQAASENVDRQLDLALEHLTHLNPDQPDFYSKIDSITTTVETLLAKTPLTRHLPIKIDGYGEAAIQTHFRQLIQDIHQSPNAIEHHRILLEKILQEWRKHVQSQAETLEQFSELSI